MDNQSEVIRQEMEETRSSLTDKVGQLEQQVAESVQVANSAVVDTVSTVKEAVQETVQTVKHSVNDTVESVKATFDLTLQVQKRPWTMLAGATLLGFFGGRLLRSTSGKPAPREERGRAAPVGPIAGEWGPAWQEGNGTPGPTAPPTFPSGIGETFHEEIAQLKGLAVGTLLGLVRDVVAKAVPKPLEHQVEEIMDGITSKLGGEPVHGRLLPESEKETVGAGDGKHHNGRKANDPGDFFSRTGDRM